GIAFAAPEIQFAFGPVLGRVGARMAAVSVGQAFDQRGSAAGAGFFVSGFGGAVNDVGILAVDDDRLKAVGAGASGRGVLHRGHIADRCVFHVEVVFAD